MRSHARQFHRAATKSRRQRDKAVDALIEAALEAEEKFTLDELEEHARRLRVARESRECQNDRDGRGQDDPTRSG